MTRIYILRKTVCFTSLCTFCVLIFTYVERHVLDILGDYLTHSNASPLQKALVEIKTPYAGSVDFEEEPLKVGYILFAYRMGMSFSFITEINVSQKGSLFTIGMLTRH